MAKVTGAAKAKKTQDSSPDELGRPQIDPALQPVDESSDNVVELVSTELKTSDDSVVTDSAINADADAATVPVPVPEPELAQSTFDIAALDSRASSFVGQLDALTDALQNSRRDWDGLNEHLTSAKAELARLRTVETDQERLTRLYAGEIAKTRELEQDLANTRAGEAAAKERAAKFEEICETIKERAYEMHLGLQQARENDQKVQAALAAVQTELADLKRVAQDNAAALVFAEDRNATLSTEIAALQESETAARDRIAKLLDDNRAMASQVPVIMNDRDKWQKQFSASERENARLQSERRTSAERVGELENEIATLRADLASLTAAPPSLTAAAPGVAAVAVEPTEAELDDELDVDLVASLRQVLAENELGDMADDPERKPEGQ